MVDVLSPFYAWIGVTLALVQSLGSSPVLMDMLNIFVSGSWISSAASIRILPGMFSGPHDFEGLILQSAL